MPSEPNKITILFLAANPVDQKPLAIDEEMRAIDDALVGAKFREMFDLRTAWAVRYGDLQELLLRYEPHIVHFSAHGSEAGELLLTGADRQSYAVPPEKLAELFDLLRDNVRCVVLNACFSAKQAQGIAASIDCVVGMTRAVRKGIPRIQISHVRHYRQRHFGECGGRWVHGCSDSKRLGDVQNYS